MNLMKEAMNELDEELVEELSGQLQAEAGGKDIPADGNLKRPARRLKWALPVAACLLLTVGVLFAAKNDLFDRKDYTELWRSVLYAGQQPETLISAYRTRIKDEAWSAYGISRICPEDLAGEKLADVTVEGAWVHYGANPEGMIVPLREPTAEETELLPAEAYAIKGIPRDAAVCLRFPEKSGELTTDRYYTYLNKNASFESLATLRKALAADSLLSITVPAQMPGAYIQKVKGDEIVYKHYVLSETGAALIRQALLAAEGTLLPEGGQDEYLKNCREIGSFSVLLEGIVSAQIRVYDSGCLVITPTASEYSLNTSRAYAIGKEAADAILQSVIQNSSLYQSETVTGVTVSAK